MRIVPIGAKGAAHARRLVRARAFGDLGLRIEQGSPLGLQALFGLATCVANSAEVALGIRAAELAAAVGLRRSIVGRRRGARVVALAATLARLPALVLALALILVAPAAAGVAVARPAVSGG